MVILRILALVFTAISLVPSAAHLFELPGKIGLDKQAYFSVQGIYAGWSHFAIPIFAAVVLNGALSLGELRRDRGAAVWALTSAVLIIFSLVDFFALVLPANEATRNWTVESANWAELRSHWETGHAIGATIVFLAFLATCMAVVRRR